MIENNPTSVVAAFEMLLEEIEVEIDFANRVGARAFESRDYDRANEALERAAQVTAFRDKIDGLRREWATLFGREEDEEGTEAHTERRNLGRSAQVSQVLERVRQRMQGVRRDVDYEPLASEPEIPRWKNTAQWARNSMVKEGLLRNGSPRGVWEISEAGKRFLQNGGHG